MSFLQPLQGLWKGFLSSGKSKSSSASTAATVEAIDPRSFVSTPNTSLKEHTDSILTVKKEAYGTLESMEALIDHECYMTTYSGAKYQKVSNMRAGGPPLRIRKVVDFNTKEELEKEEALILKRKNCKLTLQKQMDTGSITSERTLEEFMQEVKRRKSKGTLATVERSLPPVERSFSGEISDSGKSRKRVRSTSVLYSSSELQEPTQEEDLIVQQEDETLDEWLKRSGCIRRKSKSTDKSKVVKVFERRKVKAEPIECGELGPAVGLEAMDASMMASNGAESIATKSQDDKCQMSGQLALQTAVFVQEEMIQSKVSMCGLPLSSLAEPIMSDFECERLQLTCTVPEVDFPQAGSPADLSSQTEVKRKALLLNQCDVSGPDCQSPGKVSFSSFCLQTYVKLTGFLNRGQDQKARNALNIAECNYSETVIISDDFSQLTVLLSDDLSQQIAILESEDSQQTTLLCDERTQQVDSELEETTLACGKWGQLEACSEADCQGGSSQTMNGDLGGSNVSHSTSSDTSKERVVVPEIQAPSLLERSLCEAEQEEGANIGKIIEPLAHSSAAYEDMSSEQEEGETKITICESLKDSIPAEAYAAETSLESRCLNDCTDATAASDLSTLLEEKKEEQAEGASETQTESVVKTALDTSFCEGEGPVHEVAGEIEFEQVSTVEMLDVLALHPVATETEPEGTEGGSMDAVVEKESYAHEMADFSTAVTSTSALDKCLDTKLEHENRQLSQRSVWGLRSKSAFGCVSRHTDTRPSNENFDDGEEEGEGSELVQDLERETEHETLGPLSVNVLKEQLQHLAILRDRLEETSGVLTTSERIMQDSPNTEDSRNILETSLGVFESAVAASTDSQMRPVESHVMDLESPCEVGILKQSQLGSTSATASGDSQIATPSESPKKRKASTVEFCSQETAKRTAPDGLWLASGETPSQQTYAEPEIVAGCDPVHGGKEENRTCLIVNDVSTAEEGSEQNANSKPQQEGPTFARETSWPNEHLETDENDGRDFLEGSVCTEEIQASKEEKSSFETFHLEDAQLSQESLNAEETEAQYIRLTNSVEVREDFASEDMSALGSADELDMETHLSPEIGSLIKSFSSTEFPEAENPLGAPGDTEPTGEDGQEDWIGEQTCSDKAEMNEGVEDVDVEGLLTSGDISCSDANSQGEERRCPISFSEGPSKIACNRKAISPRSQLELMRASRLQSERIPSFRIKLLKSFLKDEGESCHNQSQSKKSDWKPLKRQALREDEDPDVSLADSFALTETQDNSGCSEKAPLPEPQPPPLPQRLTGNNSPSLNTPSSEEAPEGVISCTAHAAPGSPEHNKQPSLPRKSGVQHTILQSTDASLSNLASTNASSSCSSSPYTPTKRPEPSRQPKSILKSSSRRANDFEGVPCQGSCKCPRCISTCDHSKTAREFIASQMFYAERIAGRLLEEIGNMRAVMEGEHKPDVEGGPSTSSTESPKKPSGALDSAAKAEDWARKELLKMSRDSKRVCRLIDAGPRRIIFADEAGRRLNHVKYFPIKRGPENP